MTDKIKVSEIHYSYKTGFENVKSDKDVQEKDKLNYFISFKGDVIGKTIQNNIDVFQEFKEVVPFEIK